jgi:hypothetical protein
MKRLVLCVLVLVVTALAHPGSLQAAPTVLTVGDFPVTDTVIGFESIAQAELITTQFAASGPTFSGGLYGNTVAAQGPTYLGSPVTANNYIAGAGVRYNPITVAFSDTVTRVGFYAITNTNDNMTIRTFLSGVQTGSFNFNTSLTPLFLGVGDLAGIDSIEIEAYGTSLHAFAMDDFRFGGVVVPVPGAVLLAAIGVGLVGWVRRRVTV